MKINIAIETKDRRLHGHINYLAVTLGNLKRAGVFDSEHLGSFIIVSGGEQPGFYEEEVVPVLRDIPHQFVHCPVEGASRQQNAARAIRYGAMNQASDWVLKLEDDLDFIDDFLGSTVRWLHDHGSAAVPMFTLGASFQVVSQSRYAVEGESVLGPGASFPNVRAMLARGDAIAGASVNGFWGAQALLWRRHIAASLAEWLGDDPYLWDGKQQHRQRGHDLLLQVWGNTLKAKAFASTVPSFVQHIGRRSNLDQPEIGHTQPFFQFPWPGRRWRYEQRTV